MTDVLVCPSCQADNPVGFKFCGQCTEPLTPAAHPREERKVVTTLFCDLVAFTAMSEAADPEDVDALLGRYHDLGRKVIESHGGTVEKFIGDAIVGVFGVPSVHEDDPERAVRAGLRLLEALEDSGLTRPDGTPLQARCGVNTGEALVRLDVDPASGRGFLTGDAVNVAARLQSAAPPMCVVVGKSTQGLTDLAIVYDPMPPVLAKGKKQPVAAWLATGTLARRGIEARSSDLTPLVGREVELAYLSAIFDKATSQSVAQVALIVGEPGIGKSRLVRELSTLVDGRPQMTTWRQGYCPPFGEDITYGALTEILKRHSGIHDNDPVHAVEAKLEAVLPDGPDRQWVGQRLRALLGLEAPEASRDENFAAWTRFFEEVAGAEPTVLVFEDLHWADEALLAFLEYLTAHLSAVPLLLVGTARPELYERAPGFASYGPVTRINLGPLSPVETAQLVGGLLDRPVDRAKALEEVVARCEGNPFYAEQSARLLADTGLEASVPDSVQAVIAARLDTLPEGEKRLLSDASVIGSVFWEGALAAVAHLDLRELGAPLSGLLQHQLIRRLHETSMEGERELAFVHALARDVAYEQLPRAARAARHAAVARWFEDSAGERAEELGELIAHHYATAHQLAASAGDDVIAAATLDPALAYLVRAGRRAQFLDPPAAKRLFEKARDMAPEGHPLWQRIQLGMCGVYAVDLRMNEAAELAEEIIPALKASGDASGAAEALTCLANMRIYTGRDVGDLYEEALALLEVNGPSRDMILALTSAAGWHYLIGHDFEKSLALSERAVKMAADLGLPKPVGVLGIRVLVHEEQGYANVLNEYEALIEEARSQGLKDDIGLLLYNYCTLLLAIRGTRQACAGVDAGLAFAEDARMQFYAAPFRMLRIQLLVDSGEWDLAFDEAPDVVRLLSRADDHQDLLEMNSRLVLAHARRGEIERAKSLAAELEDLAARMSVVPYIRDMVRLAAVVARGPDESETAFERVRQWTASGPTVGDPSFAIFVPDALRVVVAAGDLELAEAMRKNVPPLQPLHRCALMTSKAIIREARGELEPAADEFSRAARGWNELMIPYEEAQALLGQGRCLAALGRAPEAAAALAAAREIFARLGAMPALAETDEWLARTSRA